MSGKSGVELQAEIKAEQLAAVKELVGYDHCILTVEGARRIAEPFDFNVSPQTFTDNRSEFKGVTLNGNKEGDRAEGVGAHTLAEDLCRHLGVEYASKFGRGSALRECCRALREHLEQ